MSWVACPKKVICFPTPHYTARLEHVVYKYGLPNKLTGEMEGEGGGISVLKWVNWGQTKQLDPTTRGNRSWSSWTENPHALSRPFPGKAQGHGPVLSSSFSVPLLTFCEHDPRSPSAYLNRDQNSLRGAPEATVRLFLATPATQSAAIFGESLVTELHPQAAAAREDQPIKCKLSGVCPFPVETDPGSLAFCTPGSVVR